MQSQAEVRELIAQWRLVESEHRDILEEARKKARSSVCSITVMNESGAAEMVTFEARALEKVYEGWREKFEDIMREIERRASDACLEQLGWEPPTFDMEHSTTIKERSVWKKGELSGTRMDDAYHGYEWEQGDRVPYDA